MVKFRDCYMCIDAINPAYQSIVNRCYKKSRHYHTAINLADHYESIGRPLKSATTRIEKLWDSLEVLLELLPKRELNNLNAQYSKIHGYTI
jgi:hypothetical protein